MDDLRRRLESDSSDVGRLLRALFLPKLYGNNLRFASEGAGVSSAVGNLSQTFDVSEDWANASVTQQIASSDMMCFQFANPLRAFVYFIHNQAGAGYKYDATNVNGATTWTLSPYATTQSNFGSATPDPLFPFTPHGPYLPPGHDEAGNTYLWVDGSPAAGATNNMTITLAPAPTTTSGSVNWYIWNGKSANFYASSRFVIAQTAYACPIAPPNGGAYMFAKVAMFNEPTSTSFTVSVAGNRGCWAHRAIPLITEYTTNDSDQFRVSGIRVNAAAFKAQNNSQEIEKNGNAISVTVAAAIPWCNIAAGTSYLSTLQNYRERSNAKGYYGVLLPDSDEDLSDFFDDIMPNTVNSTITNASYPLVDRRPYKALGLTAANNGGRYWLFEVTHTIEYLTNWQIQSLDNPRTSQESLTAAIVIASTMETDFENPSHWQTIINTIGKYGDRVVGFQLNGPGADVLDAISKFHPALGLARQLGKHVVLPGQQMLFQEMKNYGNSKRAKREGRWTTGYGGQMQYTDM